MKTFEKSLNFQIYQRKTDWKPRKQIWTFKYISGKQTENYEKNLNFQIYQRKTDWKKNLNFQKKTTKKSELSNISAENRLKTTKKIWTFKYISGKQTENHENKSELSNILDRKPQKNLNFQIYQRKTDWKLRKKSELSNISAENRLKTTKKNLNFQIYQRKTDWKLRKKSELSNISAENRLKTTKKNLNFQMKTKKKIWSAENRLKTTKTNLNFQIY